MKKSIFLLLILVSTITFASTQATKSVVKIHSSVSLPNNKQYPLLRWKKENITKGLFKNKGYAFQLEDL